MKNVPETIFLQVGDPSNWTEEELRDYDFAELEKVTDGVTWCRDRIFKTDIEFVRKDVSNLAGWHKYEEDKPKKEMAALVIHADTSFAIRFTKKVNGGFALPKSEKGYKPLYWMEVPQVPKDLS